MTIHLPKDIENSIQAAVQSGRFSSADDAITAAWLAFNQPQRQASPQPLQATEEEAAPAQKPIWERILERTADIPDEEWDKLPTDLAEQHDHYLYGVPKRPTT